MKIFSCRENLSVEVHEYPFHQSLNESLMSDFSKINFLHHTQVESHTNIKGNQFNFPMDQKPKGIDLIENWVKNIIQSNISSKLEFVFTTWASRLDKGQETIPHNHMPFCNLTYVYFVNTPKGSSPLVFPISGKRIKAEAGKLVLFPSIATHKVPINNCDNRMTIASNINISEVYT